MKQLFFLSILAIAVSACHSHEEGNEAPTITIASPTGGQIFKSGATINITGTASDDVDLHEGTITIKNATTELFKQTPDVHSKKTFEINYNYVAPTVTVNTTLDIIFSFYDHDENHTEKTISIQIQP